MKISIINPNLSGCVSILDCGITYLATYINQRTDHTATIWDYTFKRKVWQTYLKEKFATDKPDAIGISFTTLYEGYVRDTINFIRTHCSKKIPIIIGGVHPTLKPDDAIRIDGVDVVVLGEGEETLSDILNALSAGNNLNGIPGLIYKTSDGEIVQNPLRPWIKDINSLPFPNYDLWEEIDTYFYFLSQLWLIGTRGCPYSCVNCEELPLRRAIPGKRYRVRDPKNYVEEISYHYEKYKDRGFRMAHPFDPVFPLDRNWTKRFCEEYIKSGLSRKLPFSIFSRGDTFFLNAREGAEFDEEKLRWLAEAGCKEIRVGIESGTERMRNEIHQKNVSNYQLRESFRYFKKYNIITIGYNMLGGPTETKNDLIQTFKMNVELNPDKPIFFIYQPLTHDLTKMGLVEQDHEIGSHILTKRSKKKLERSSQDQATIQFGEPMPSEYYSKNWIIIFQYFCYSYFVAKRMLKLIIRQKHRFFINFYHFMIRGHRVGANMKIVFAYFLSASGDNLFS